MTDWLDRVHFGDCAATLRKMPAGLAHTCVTSPPYYGLRDYGHPGQIGLEATPEAFIRKLVKVFRHVRRVLRDDGTLWVNMGDSYCTAAGATDDRRGRSGNLSNGGLNGAAVPTQRARPVAGLKPKDLIGIPWMLAFALRADGWYLRQDIVWSKPNPMPESVKDRCTKSHEYIFLLSKSERYYFDQGAIAERLAEASVSRLAQDIDAQAGSARVPGKTNGTMKAVPPRFGGAKYGNSDDPRHRTKSGNAYTLARKTATEGPPGQPLQHREDREPVMYEGRRNKRSVWSVSTKPYGGAHFAVFPPDLIEPCILAGAPGGGVVLDPFIGSGTTGQVSQQLGRHFVGCELNPAYEPLQQERLRQPALMLEECLA